MICSEVQDALWDVTEPPAHVATCGECSAARDEIARIRRALAGPATRPLEAGILARMSRPRSAPSWKVAAALLVGVAAGFLFVPKSPRLPEIATPRPPTPLQALVARFENDPGFEEVLIRALNDTLRRRSDTPSDATAGTPEVMQ